MKRWLYNIGRARLNSEQPAASITAREALFGQYSRAVYVSAGRDAMHHSVKSSFWTGLNMEPDLDRWAVVAKRAGDEVPTARHPRSRETLWWCIDKHDVTISQ